MAVSIILSITGAGTQFSGEVGHLGRLESNISRRPRRHFVWLSLNNRQHLQWNKYFWPIPRTRALNFNPRGSPLLLAYGKEAEDSFLSNANKDSDEIFDDLFEKYGKVVFRRNDQKPPTVEVDDDAESLSFAVEIAKVVSEVKAADIKVLFVKPLVYWTQFFIIATAFSHPQIDAIGTRIRDLAEKKYGKVPSGDTKPNSWTLLDFGDVVIHIFLPQQRAFYNLEEFYGNATPIELPFENQPPFRS